MARRVNFSKTEVATLSAIHEKETVKYTNMGYYDVDPLFLQHVDGVKVRMTRRKFRDFLHDQIGISSQVIADRIFIFFNKASYKEIPLISDGEI